MAALISELLNITVKNRNSSPKEIFFFSSGTLKNLLVVAEYSVVFTSLLPCLNDQSQSQGSVSILPRVFPSSCFLHQC